VRSIQTLRQNPRPLWHHPPKARLHPRQILPRHFGRSASTNASPSCAAKKNYNAVPATVLPHGHGHPTTAQSNIRIGVPAAQRATSRPSSHLLWCSTVRLQIATTALEFLTDGHCLFSAARLCYATRVVQPDRRILEPVCGLSAGERGSRIGSSLIIGSC
jgi:hypothetical protein